MAEHWFPKPAVGGSIPSCRARNKGRVSKLASVLYTRDGKVAYKKDQGRYARMVAFWTLITVVFTGLWQMRYWLESLGSTKGAGIKGVIFTILGIQVTPAVLICLGLAVGAAILLHVFLNKPKKADLLIDTESELRKCTWPSIKETWSASLVVLVTVVVCMVFLAVSDFLLQAVFSVFIFAG